MSTKSKLLPSLLFSVSMACVSAQANAADSTCAPDHGIVNLTNTVSDIAPNDELQIIATLDQQGTSLADLQAKSSAVVNTIIKKVKDAGLDVELVNQQVYPQYTPQGKPSGVWQYSGSIKVVATDFDKLNSILPFITQKFRIASTQFGVSNQLRNKLTANLKARAIKQFMAEAQTTASLFGKAKYVVKEVTLTPAQQNPVPVPMMARSMAMGGAVEAVAVSSEGAGQSTVSYTVTGSIKLED